MGNFFFRHWFFRLWVFQEAVSAKRISVLHVTRLTVWESVHNRSESLLDFLKELCRYTMGFAFQLSRTLNTFLVGDIVDTAAKLSNRTSVDLAHLMSRMDTKSCQDPRDKSFSLIGLAGDTLPIDLVDYSHPITVVNREYVRHIIKRTGSLKAITYQNRVTSERRSSWVLLWHEKLGTGMSDFHYDACASLRRKWRSSSSKAKDHLVVSGKDIDLIMNERISFMTA